MIAPPVKAKRGFATLSPDEVRRLAALGGHKAHAYGTGCHAWSGADARAAGRKGGLVAQAKRRAPTAKKDGDA